jgi:hypothetical protein
VDPECCVIVWLDLLYEVTSKSHNYQFWQTGKMVTQKYKLKKVADGETPVCAFFKSDKGCNNGAKCKFLHTTEAGSGETTVSPKKQKQPRVKVKAKVTRAPTPTKSSDESSSLVSSESEASEDELPVPRAPVAKKKTPLKRKANEQAGTPAKVKKSPSAAKKVANASNPFEEKTKGAVKKKGTKSKESIFEESMFATREEAPIATSPKPKKMKKDVKPKIVVKAAPKVNAFRSLMASLPVAAFEETSPPSDDEEDEQEDEDASNESASEVEDEEESIVEDTILPTSHPDGIQWQDLMKKCRKHPMYANEMNYENAREKGGDWFTAKPYGPDFASNPQVIAVDCEMCGTRDPKSGARDMSALCRLSVVDVSNGTENAETLIDTLVKPQWKITDDRAWVNGIPKSKLENVQFTLKHAQDFMRALCSEETVIAGHSVINDLRTLKMEHHCIVDSAYLFKVKGREHGHAALRDLAPQILGKDMPSVHCSVNDAIVAMECIEAFRDREGEIEPIVPTKKPLPPFLQKGNKDRSGGRRNSRENGRRKSFTEPQGASLLVHRIPSIVKEQHLEQLFTANSNVKPKSVGDIDFSAGKTGKAFVRFDSPDHAELAYKALTGSVSQDAGGYKQKSIKLKNGDYLRVRSHRPE